ncbi:MAG: sterol desaturase family protein [Phycisphaerales bacterium]|nr:sterol desaturase family protein [Phycisphaerales bacterium]
MWILITVFFVSITIFHLLEPLAPVTRAYKAGVTRRGYLADCIAVAVNGPGLSALEKVAFTWLITRIPADTIPQLQAVFGANPWWLQFLLFFLVNDFLRYWFHRWYHESNLLWRVHRVHHTIVEMDAMSVFRHHVLEAVIKNGLIFLPLRLLGVEASVIIAYSCFDVVKGFWHHANLRCRIGPLNYVLNSPELHWWHHETNPRGQYSNYGSVLSIWDVLFGTFYYRPGEWPEEIGVAGMERFPDGYLGQLASIRFDDETLVRRLAEQAAGDARPADISPRGEPAPSS